MLKSLIFNRTENDVQLVKDLRKKILDLGGFDKLTDDEQALFLTDLKGAYNASDLNRVGEWVLYLSTLYPQLSYDAPTINVKIDWVNSDYVSENDSNNYLNSLRAVRNVIPELASVLPEVPDTLTMLNHNQANDIEKLCYLIDEYVKKIIAVFRPCGTFASGGMEGLI